MTESDSTPIAPIWQRRFWMPALLVLALFAFGSHGGNGRLDGTAFSFGQVTGGALFLWLIFYIVISRKLSWKHSLFAFAVLFMASLVGKMSIPDAEHAATVKMIDSV